MYTDMLKRTATPIIGANQKRIIANPRMLTISGRKLNHKRSMMRSNESVPLPIFRAVAPANALT